LLIMWSLVIKFFTNTLGYNSDLDVVATAVNEKLVLQKFSQVNFDILTLDIGIPERDGLQTLV
jgi:chemotaxis response regulator CheB